MPTIACPSCGARLDLPADLIGEKVRCPRCRKTFGTRRKAMNVPQAPVPVNAASVGQLVVPVPQLIQASAPPPIPNATAAPPAWRSSRVRAFVLLAAAVLLVAAGTMTLTRWMLTTRTGPTGRESANSAPASARATDAPPEQPVASLSSRFADSWRLSEDL
jgi:hypothetical protein